MMVGLKKGGHMGQGSLMMLHKKLICQDATTEKQVSLCFHLRWVTIINGLIKCVAKKSLV